MDKQVLVKAGNFCAYQERTQEEVRQRLKAWEVYGHEAEEIIARLIEQNFINEERFARAYAGGKFRAKKWGKIKIQYALKAKGLSPHCIKKGLEEIDDEEYFLVLQAILHKKMHEYRNLENGFARNKKAADFAIRKGYEGGLVWEVLKKKD